MKQNVGIIDRIIRVLLAIGLFYVAMTWPMTSAIRIILSVVGGLLLVTSVTGFCLIYKLFGWSTLKSHFSEPVKKMDDSSDTQEPLFKGQ
jgi:hypothetical protein